MLAEFQGSVEHSLNTTDLLYKYPIRIVFQFCFNTPTVLTAEHINQPPNVVLDRSLDGLSSRRLAVLTDDFSRYSPLSPFLYSLLSISLKHILSHSTVSKSQHLKSVVEYTNETS